MILTALARRRRSQRFIGVSTFTCSLLAALISEAAPISVFGLGYQLIIGPPSELPSELYRFNETGPMEQRWDIPETPQAASMATNGTSLYAVGFRQAIHEYDFNGAFLGQFADVRSLAGPTPNRQMVEFDAVGNMYTAFGGHFSQPRTSFRLDQDGSITETFSHVDLVFPSGIDATATGDVYILNSAGVGVGDRLFKFNSSGTYLSDYSIPETDNPSDIAINEVNQELYMADSFGESIHIYDISSGEPIFTETLSVPGRALDVFVEPISGRIFGTYSTFDEDEMGQFSYTRGFEISRNGSLLNFYVEDAPLREQRVTRIVAVVVPEPSSALLAFSVIGLYLMKRRQKHDFVIH